MGKADQISDNVPGFCPPNEASKLLEQALMQMDGIISVFDPKMDDQAKEEVVELQTRLQIIGCPAKNYCHVRYKLLYFEVATGVVEHRSFNF